MYKILGGDGKQYGPVSAEKLLEWVREGRANAQTMVMAEGTTAWVPLGSVPELTPAAAYMPLESGSYPAAVTPTDEREGALRLAVPAGWALTIIGILGVLMCIGLIIFFAIRGVENSSMLNMLNKQDVTEAERIGQRIGFFTTLVVGIAWAGFIAFAGGKLRRLESWGLVLTAGIMCVLPCCGTQAPLCFLSAPVGIWVIVVICLNKVKPTFT